MVLTSRLMWLLAAVCLSLPLWAFLWATPGMPLMLRVLIAALLGVSALQPHAGLLGLAVVGPMAVPVMIAVGGAPIGGNAMFEAMVLATVAGVVWRWAIAGHLTGGRLGLPSLLLGGAAIASVTPLVGLPSWTHLTRDYFAQPRNAPALHEAAVWIEALLAAVMIERFVMRDQKLGHRLALAAACGLAAESVYSLLRLGQIVGRSADVLDALWRHALSTRISPHFPDPNAMGSLFALGAVGWAVVSIGKDLSQWQRAGALLGALIVGAALWLTGSRAAIVAAAITMFVMWWHVRRPSLKAVGATLALTAMIGITIFLAAKDLSQRPRATPEKAMNIRVELAMAGIRMAADHPWRGVGLGEFSRYSPQYISQSLIGQFPAAVYGENAHNQFIQILAELGVIGLVVYVWYWIRVLGPAVRTLRTGESHAWLAAGTAGLCAFHLSALLGHPFLTPYVLFFVFVSAGVVAGHSSPSATHRSGPRVTTVNPGTQVPLV